MQTFLSETLEELIMAVQRFHVSLLDLVFGSSGDPQGAPGPFPISGPSHRQRVQHHS